MKAISKTDACRNATLTDKLKKRGEDDNAYASQQRFVTAYLSIGHPTARQLEPVSMHAHTIPWLDSKLPDSTLYWLDEAFSLLIVAVVVQI